MNTEKALHVRTGRGLVPIIPDHALVGARIEELREDISEARADYAENWSFETMVDMQEGISRLRDELNILSELAHLIQDLEQ